MIISSLYAYARVNEKKILISVRAPIN